MPTWTYIALGFLAGVPCGAWIAHRWCSKLIHDKLREEIRMAPFWRKRWIDIVRRLDEQDVKQ